MGTSMNIDLDHRRFLGAVAATLGVAQFGMLDTADA